MSGRPWLVLRIKSMQYDVAAENTRNQGAEFYGPFAMVRSSRSHRMHSAPLFPGYAFARPSGASWTFLKFTRGVQDVLMGTGDMPSFVPDAEIASIRAREDDEGLVQLPSGDFKPGEAVRVEDGPMVGLTGIYEGMSAQERVFVLLEVLGRKVRAEFPMKSIGRV